jgi:cytoskeleton protein RodZ
MESRKKATPVGTEDSAPPVETGIEPGLSIGEVFSEARRLKKQTIEQISTELCIRGVYLKAIEEMHLKDLPEPVYTLGFVRCYAKYLSMNEEEAVQRFKKEIMGIQPEKSLNFPKTLPKKGSPKIPVVVISSLVFLGALFWLYTKDEKMKAGVSDLLGAFQSKSQDGGPLDEGSSQLTLDPLSPPQAPSEADSSLTLASPPSPDLAPSLGEIGPATPSPASSPSVNTPPADPSSRISLTVESRSWVEIIDKNGHIFLSRILNPGESYAVPSLPGLILNTGNAGGIRIIVDGQAIPSLGQYGMPRRNISLDPDRLLSTTQPSSPAPSPSPAPAPAAGPTPSSSGTQGPEEVAPAPKVKPRVPPKAAPPKPKSLGIMPPVVMTDKSMDLIPSEGIGSISG